MGRKADDLPEIELIDQLEGEETAAEVVVASRPRPGTVWLVTGIAVLGIGAVVSSVSGSQELENAAPTSTTSSTTSTTLGARADVAGGPGADSHLSAGVLATYDLTMPGATLQEDTMSGPTGLPVTVWASADAQLSLAVRGVPGGPDGPGARNGSGPCRPDSSVDWLSESQDTIWVTVPPSDPTALLCWNRSSGDFWILRARWNRDTPPVADRTERLRAWALGIRADGPTGTYTLQDQQMRRVASDAGGPTRARARVWDYDGHEIVLFVIENSSAGSLSNLLATGRTDRIGVWGLGDIWMIR